MTPAAQKAAEALRPIVKLAKKLGYLDLPYDPHGYVGGGITIKNVRDCAKALAALEAEAAQPNPEELTVRELREWLASRPKPWSIAIACVDRALEQMPARPPKIEAVQTTEDQQGLLDSASAEMGKFGRLSAATAARLIAALGRKP